MYFAGLAIFSQIKILQIKCISYEQKLGYTITLVTACTHICMNFGIAESYVFGEVKDGRQSVGHKQPVKPLLQEGWKASSVKCTVPKLYQPSTGASTKPFVITTNTELGPQLSVCHDI